MIYVIMTDTDIACSLSLFVGTITVKYFLFYMLLIGINYLGSESRFGRCERRICLV